MQFDVHHMLLSYEDSKMVTACIWLQNGITQHPKYNLGMEFQITLLILVFALFLVKFLSVKEVLVCSECNIHVYIRRASKLNNYWRCMHKEPRRQYLTSLHNASCFPCILTYLCYFVVEHYIV